MLPDFILPFARAFSSEARPAPEPDCDDEALCSCWFRGLETTSLSSGTGDGRVPKCRTCFKSLPAEEGVWKDDCFSSGSSISSSSSSKPAKRLLSLNGRLGALPSPLSGPLSLLPGYRCSTPGGDGIGGGDEGI